MPANFELIANESSIYTLSESTAFNYTYPITQNTNFTLNSTHDSQTITRLFKAIIKPTVTEESLPPGLNDGINYHLNDPSKVTLVLYAPYKEFVHVIGDFNNWEIDNAFLLKKDSAKDRFWIELTSLTPQQKHLFQYLVEFEINIADPYSTTILDEYNDTYINEITYPNLPIYPKGKTTEAVSVFSTGEVPYNWKTTNFQKPSRDNLVIYELLIRDFDLLHSFDAVKARLDYLQNLGINAIELLPVSEFDGNESWGYNPSFHMALDKYYGTTNAFKSLIDECHSRGIAVILDVVYNHASGQHPYFRLWNDSNGGLEGKPTSENPFFNIEAKHSYSVFNDFNHQSEATQDYVERTIKYWIEEYKIDGFRWDLTKGFTQNCVGSTQEICTNAYNADRVEVLKSYADYQWELDPFFYVIFEHLGVGGSADEETEWANYRLSEGKGIMLWNNFNHQYNEATMGYHANNGSNFSTISYKDRGWLSPSNISYMESHDEERLMYKTLNFGNSNSNYNTKNEATALKRMQQAAAFFFTIPGPKMIWQFGELGFDYSIEYNGRVGNKPIRWDYIEDSERRALYDVYSNLIKLKLGEPIFRATDFTINAGDENGLKTVHLTLPSANEGELANVTIIGNFGITTQQINPNFQKEGIWYNILDGNRRFVVSNSTASIVLQPGEYRIYGDQPSALFPDLNIPDQDYDGIADADDLCPDTPLGSMVDIYGCTVYTLPSNNFQISVTNETCRTANNGKINVNVDEKYNYKLSIHGPNNFYNTFSFNTLNWSLDGLFSGIYTLCFTIDEHSDFEQCFTVQISEPEDLSVFTSTKFDEHSASLTMSGANRFLVTLNGITTETSEQKITLQLKNGLNTIKVSTGIDCQGIYEKSIFIQNKIDYYPNPATDKLIVKLNNEDRIVDVLISSLEGKIMYLKTMEIQGNTLEIPMQQLAPGNYFISLKGILTDKTLKIVIK